jgi:hypothetical protein
MGVALRYALYLTRNGHRAEELAAEAIAASVDPERSLWDPQGKVTLDQHVVNVVDGLLKRDVRKARRRADPVRAASVDWRMGRKDMAPDAPLRARERRARAEERAESVRAGLGELGKQVFDGLCEGLSAADQARALHVDVQKVYGARRQIAERIRALPPDEPGGEDMDPTAAQGELGDDGEEQGPEGSEVES